VCVCVCVCVHSGPVWMKCPGLIFCPSPALLTPLSDHSKITIYLKRAQSKSGAPSACELFNSTYSNRWTPDSMGAYQKALENQNIYDLTHLFLNETFPQNNSGVNSAVDKINSIFHHLAALSNLKTSKPKPQQTNSDKWFDTE